MTQCSAKKLQLSFLGVNQISFSICDRTWKVSLFNSECPLVLWVVPKAAGSHLAKPSSSVCQFRGELVLLWNPALVSTVVTSIKYCQRPKLLAYISLWKLVYLLWKRFLDLLIMQFVSHAESGLHLLPFVDLCIYSDLNQQRVLVQWYKVHCTDVFANLIVKITAWGESQFIKKVGNLKERENKTT